MPDSSKSIGDLRDPADKITGSLRSPMLLELSGIGNPGILRQFDIPVQVNISTVLMVERKMSANQARTRSLHKRSRYWSDPASSHRP
jgi:hypothetical protein